MLLCIECGIIGKTHNQNKIRKEEFPPEMSQMIPEMSHFSVLDRNSTNNGGKMDRLIFRL